MGSGAASAAGTFPQASAAMRCRSSWRCAARAKSSAAARFSSAVCPGRTSSASTRSRTAVTAGRSAAAPAHRPHSHRPAAARRQSAGVPCAPAAAVRPPGTRAKVRAPPGRTAAPPSAGSPGTCGTGSVRRVCAAARTGRPRTETAAPVRLCKVRIALAVHAQHAPQLCRQRMLQAQVGVLRVRIDDDLPRGAACLRARPGQAPERGIVIGSGLVHGGLLVHFCLL